MDLSESSTHDHEHHRDVRTSPRSDERHAYGSKQVTHIRIAYISVIILFITLVVYFRLYTNKAWFILILPFIIFAIGMYNATGLTEEDEDDMFKASYLSVGAIISLPLLSWMNKDYNGDVYQFVHVIGIAMIFTMLTLVDIWFPRCHRSTYRHVRSSFQTISISLILFAFTAYFLHRTPGRLQ